MVFIRILKNVMLPKCCQCCQTIFNYLIISSLKRHNLHISFWSYHLYIANKSYKTMESLKILKGERILLPVSKIVKDEIKEIAKEEDISLSEYIRRLIFADIRKRGRSRLLTRKILKVCSENLI